MTIETPIRTTSAELEAIERREAEILERAELAANAKPAPITFVDERLLELERLAAADLVLKMRNVDALSLEADDAERARFAAIFERIGKQFEAASLRLKRARAHAGVPEFIREGSQIPLRNANRRITT